MDSQWRITVKNLHPNPLFEKWLEEFIDSAKKSESKSYFQLQKALNSLKRYPLLLQTGQDCIILEGFGRKICDLLERKLDHHIRLLIPETATVSVRTLSNKFQAGASYQAAKKSEEEAVMEIVSSSINLGKSKNYFEILPENYEILLLVDSQETIGKSKAHTDRSILEMNRLKLKHEIRRLSVGDFLWIARDLKNGRELVLPYIIERKRLDDLASSIKDGRFQEQKFRLSISGLKVIYLIEGMEKSFSGFGLPNETIMQAIANISVQSDFQIKFVENNIHTVMFLNILTNHLIIKFKGKVLRKTMTKFSPGLKEELQEFTEFQKNFVKTKRLNVEEVFIKQLLQLRRLSIDKALAITETYSTPRSLYLNYQGLNENDGEKLLTSLRYEPSRRAVGASISKIVYKFFSSTISS